MPIKSKAKAKEKVASLGGGLSLKQKVDRVGELTEQVNALDTKISGLAAVKKLRAQQDELIDQISELTNEVREELEQDLGDDDNRSIAGKRFVASLGARAKSRVITDMKALANAVGLDKFYELCTFRLGDVDKYTTPDEQAEFIETKQDGARKFAIKEL